MLKTLFCLPFHIVQWLQKFDWLGPLAIRLYLIPIFWIAGIEKLNHIDSTAAWFGNEAWGLGLPFPYVMAYLASFIEIFGAALLVLGLGTRFICIPLLIVMFVAAYSVHWENGWLAIASQNSEAFQRLNEFLQWLKETHPQRHSFITELGKPVILNNGIEFAVTYIILLLSLFFSGGGRFISLDYWIGRYYRADNHETRH